MRKFISLFLIFSILILSGNLMAKEKRGAELIVKKKDGQQVRGELIAVKDSSLLLLVSGVDVSVDVNDVNVIKIIKKSKTALCAGLGVILGAAGAGAGYGLSYAAYQCDKRQSWAGIGLVIGLVSGVTIGQVLSVPTTIQIEGRPDTEVKDVLDKLRSKARIPDYQ